MSQRSRWTRNYVAAPLWERGRLARYGGEIDEAHGMSQRSRWTKLLGDMVLAGSFFGTLTRLSPVDWFGVPQFGLRGDEPFFSLSAHVAGETPCLP